MAITLESSATSIQTDGLETNQVVTMPSGITSGDLLIAIVTCDGSVTITGPSGWTQLWQGLSGTSVVCSGWYKVSDGTEGATQTWTTNFAEQSSHICLRFSGYTGTPEAGTLATANSTSCDPPSLTPSGGSDDYLYIAVAEYNDGTFTISGYPSGYTSNQITSVTSTAAGTGCAVSMKQATSSTSDDPSAYTISSAARNGGQTIAIAPSATGNPHYYYAQQA